MKKIVLILALVTSISAIVGCKKSDNPLENPLELNDLNLRATYRIREVLVNGVSVYSSYPACKLNDEYIFTGGGAYTYVDVAPVCTPAAATSGKYGIISKTQMTLDGVDYTVDSFTGLELVLTNTTSGVKTTITFSKK